MIKVIHASSISGIVNEEVPKPAYEVVQKLGTVKLTLINVREA
jgi:hypothetical protein